MTYIIFIIINAQKPTPTFLPTLHFFLDKYLVYKINKFLRIPLSWMFIVCLATLASSEIYWQCSKKRCGSVIFMLKKLSVVSKTNNCDYHLRFQNHPRMFMPFSRIKIVKVSEEKNICKYL